jgi:hypothetical protein
VIRHSFITIGADPPLPKGPVRKELGDFGVAY